MAAPPTVSGLTLGPTVSELRLKCTNSQRKVHNVNRSKTATWVKVVAGSAALSLSLAACGGTDEEPAASASDTASAEPSSEAPAETMTNDECKAGDTSKKVFKVGGILPLTGNLAYLGPAEISGVGLAISDINAAGGVNGVMACHAIEDSGDSTDLSIAKATAGKLIAGKPSVVVGAASSSVTLSVVDDFADNKIVEVSPANTAVDLSGYSPYYFRTAPPDTIQGNALGTLVATDGNQKVAFLVFNDTYGTGLRNSTQAAIEAAGGQVVYGAKGDGDEFPAGQTTFSAEVPPRAGTCRRSTCPTATPPTTARTSRPARWKVPRAPSRAPTRIRVSRTESTHGPKWVWVPL